MLGDRLCQSPIELGRQAWQAASEITRKRLDGQAYSPAALVGRKLQGERIGYIFRELGAVLPAGGKLRDDPANGGVSLERCHSGRGENLPGRLQRDREPVLGARALKLDLELFEPAQASG